MRSILTKILFWVALCSIVFFAFGCGTTNHTPRYQHPVEKPVKMKAAKSKRPKTDILIMSGVLFAVVMWCNEEGFYKHVD